MTGAAGEFLLSLFLQREGASNVRANARFYAPGCQQAELRILKEICDGSGLRVRNPVPTKTDELLAVSHIGAEGRGVFARVTDFLPGGEPRPDDPDYLGHCFRAGGASSPSKPPCAKSIRSRFLRAGVRAGGDPGRAGLTQWKNPARWRGILVS